MGNRPACPAAVTGVVVPARWLYGGVMTQAADITVQEVALPGMGSATS
ncbi:hypothetical protein [Streptomyces goshikiensis]